MVPKEFFFTKGVGGINTSCNPLSLRCVTRISNNATCVCLKHHPTPLHNHPKRQGEKEPTQVKITYVVMSRNSTNEPNRLDRCSSWYRCTKDRSHYGYISEHHAFGTTGKKLEDYRRSCQQPCLGPRSGLEFDPDKAWDKRKQEYKMSGRLSGLRCRADRGRYKNGCGQRYRCCCVHGDQR